MFTHQPDWDELARPLSRTVARWRRRRRRDRPLLEVSDSLQQVDVNLRLFLDEVLEQFGGSRPPAPRAPAAPGLVQRRELRDGVADAVKRPPQASRLPLRLRDLVAGGLHGEPQRGQRLLDVGPARGAAAPP